VFRIEQPTNCYACFALLYIRPTREGFADLSTCCTNVEKKANRVTVRSGIASAWNHPNFLRQRALVNAGDWSFCRGHKCMPFRLYPDFEALCNEPEVLRSREAHRCELSYLPRAVWMITSYACNNACPFCYQKNESALRADFTLQPALVSEIRERLIPQAKYVAITGGEPFLNDADLIAYIAEKHPGITLGIGTNGALLHRYGIDRLVRQGIRLTISVYGFEEAVYNTLTRSNNYRLFRANLDALLKKDYAARIRLDYIVMNAATMQNLRLFVITTGRGLNFNRRSASCVGRNSRISGTA
jgi:pyruvate-formate lyase-activating enzyme